MWSWDGAHAESLIFCSEDVEDLDDESLENLVKSTSICQADSGVTLSRKEKYTFTNFNFDTGPESD